MTWPVPTARLALAAALAAPIAAVLPGERLIGAVWITAALVGAALVDAAVAVDPRRLAIERDLPAVVALGGATEVRWRVRNMARRPVTVALADDLAPSLGAAARRARGRVLAGGELRASAALQPTRRGRFRLREVAVRTNGPLGLGGRQRRRSVPGELRVHPAFPSRADAELRVVRARLADVGLRSARARGGGTEFDQLREYGVDDEVRRIDWAATARADRPMVRTYRAERNQTVLVLIDSGRTTAGLVAGVPRVEHAMDAALGLTLVASRLGDRAGLVAYDRRVRAVVGPSSRRDQPGRVADALHDLEPALVESDPAEAFRQVLTRFRRRALLVVLTDLAAAPIGEALLPALPLVARRHAVVVGAVRDPVVAAWAAAPPDEPSAAYRSAAAATALADRALVTAKLRALGVTVVDAEPGDLAPRLLDAYLDVKATGRV